MPKGARGVVSIRGRIIPVIDLRRALGLSSLRAELEEIDKTLVARAADHVQWVQELRRSVEERRPFELSVDPTQCAFGKWYRTFRTENVCLRMVLEKIEEPHRQLHARGAIIAAALKLGECRTCTDELAAAEHRELPMLATLFAEAREAIYADVREILVVARVMGREVGLAVDSVTAVRRLAASECTPHTGQHLGACEAWTTGFAVTGGKVVSLLDLNQLGNMYEDVGKSAARP